MPQIEQQDHQLLQTRKLNYKEDLINDALRRKYELWVRFKQARSAEEAQAWENALLAAYDYACNVRNNGNIRAVP